MGGSAKAPKPSAEERALQAQQAALLKTQQEIILQQREQQKILIPFFAEQEGFDVELDDQGNIKSIKKVAKEIDTMKAELEKQLTQRSLDALAGNLPVSPGLEKSLRQEEQTLKERLASQLGTGWETSSAGIETMSKFSENAEALREGARTGQLTLSEQLGMARSQQNDFERLTSNDYLRQISTGDNMTMAGALGQVASGYGAAIQPYVQQRQMQFQASMANQQSRMGLIGAGIGAIGSIFSTPAAGAALFSDERLKSYAVQIGTLKPMGIPIYEYTMGGVRRIGVFASDVEKHKPEAVTEGFGYKKVNYEAIDDRY